MVLDTMSATPMTIRSISFMTFGSMSYYKCWLLNKYERYQDALTNRAFIYPAKYSGHWIKVFGVDVVRINHSECLFLIWVATKRSWLTQLDLRSPSAMSETNDATKAWSP